MPESLALAYLDIIVSFLWHHETLIYVVLFSVYISLMFANQILPSGKNGCTIFTVLNSCYSVSLKLYRV